MGELNLLYVHGESIGYGRLGVKLAEALCRQGVDVYDELPCPPGEARSFEKHEGARAKRCNVVAWVSTPTHARGWWKSQHPVMFTMWESSRLPESFRETLDAFETVVVPSWHNVELFSKYHPRVRFVPCGVDPTEWFYVPRTPPEREFRFMIGGSGNRKGLDLAWKAYNALWGKDGSWGSGPTPTLLFKSPRGGTFPNLGGRVRVLAGKLPAAEERDVYATAHCYLQPSRGEGFGLQPLQALAQGCPTILTAAHGHESYAHLGYGLSTTYSQSDYFIYGDAGEWWEPSLDELVEWMRWVYDNPAQAFEDAARSAEIIAAEWTWDRTAEQFVDAIGADLLEQPFVPTDDWHQPPRRLYPVIVQQSRMIDVGGYNHWFEAGETYWEPADVKRVLYENGALDPACLARPDDPESEELFDLGITENQAERLGVYRASRSYCPTCKQRLNSVPTLSDDLYELLERNEPFRFEA